MYSSTQQAGKSQFFLVYDKQTGKVVHIHEVVSDDLAVSIAEQDMEKQALDLAPKKYGRDSLAVFHPDPGQRFAPNEIYRIDQQGNSLIVESVSVSDHAATTK